MNDKTIRNLAHLQDSASTARVLNLLRIQRRFGSEAEHESHPFFQNPTLNRCIILKHRLRRHEQELFTDGRQTATKVILPIDGADLRVGGRSVLVGQTNYDAIMMAVFGDTWMTEPHDRDLLKLLDDLPSLDPFLLREHLRRFDLNPARCYFEISDADMRRMIGFVEHEIQRLIDLCFAGVEVADDSRAGSRLVKKILSNAVDGETEPLRLTLRLEKKEYQEGVFCWKGFLYYKWTLKEAMPKVNGVVDAIAKARPRGSIDHETRAYLEKARGTLRRSIFGILQTAERTLKVYDQAFAGLVDGNPLAFRDFLLTAPNMFTDLGERLGAVSHIVSFWSYRFPAGRLPVVAGSELMDIFTDFENSLSFPELKAQQGQPVAQTG
ncbi:MAG: hypothetical protein ACHP84_07840 [Caulobacterales bacterium]